MCSVSLFQFLSYWFFVCENRPAEALVRSWVSLSHGRARLYHDIWWWVLVVPSNNQRVIVSCLIPLNRITADQGWIPPGLPAAVSTIYIYIYIGSEREKWGCYIYIYVVCWRYTSARTLQIVIVILLSLHALLRCYCHGIQNDCHFICGHGNPYDGRQYFMHKFWLHNISI